MQNQERGSKHQVASKSLDCSSLALSHCCCALCRSWQ